MRKLDFEAGSVSGKKGQNFGETGLSFMWREGRLGARQQGRGVAAEMGCKAGGVVDCWGGKGVAGWLLRQCSTLRARAAGLSRLLATVLDSGTGRGGWQVDDGIGGALLRLMTGGRARAWEVGLAAEVRGEERGQGRSQGLSRVKDQRGADSDL